MKYLFAGALFVITAIYISVRIYYNCNNKKKCEGDKVSTDLAKTDCDAKKRCKTATQVFIACAIVCLVGIVVSVIREMEGGESPSNRPSKKPSSSSSGSSSRPSSRPSSSSSSRPSSRPSSYLEDTKSSANKNVEGVLQQSNLSAEYYAPSQCSCAATPEATYPLLGNIGLPGLNLV